MIHEGLIEEIATICPDVKRFYVEPDNRDECPPYVVLNYVSGVPEFPAGDQCRVQITGASYDKGELEAMMKDIKELFHDKAGIYGGVSVSSMGCVLDNPISPKDDNWIYYKSFDLKIFSR